MREKNRAKWHLASYMNFINETLAELLSEKLPLVGYVAEETGRRTMNITFTVSQGSADTIIKFQNVIKPGNDGVFRIDDRLYVVVPRVESDNLEHAGVYCVGEQLAEYIGQRLNQASGNPDSTDAAYIDRYPIGKWIRAFVENEGQHLDTTNWISRNTHLRRIIIPHTEKMIATGQRGRVCPFEIPPTAVLLSKKVFSLAEGAEIRHGKIKKSPDTWLGSNPGAIPFLEYNSSENIMCGSNVMRQSFEPPDPEPALVQTGREPDDSRFWNGRNLLTAFISWGADTCYRGIVISESCAKRLYWPYPVEAGDKMSNRHGARGVVSSILPDAAMPRLSDGTPVELIYNFSELHKQKNYGQVLEAVAGRLAALQEEPVIIPPLQAPGRDEFKEMLLMAGLPETGMERLTLGKGGKTCSYASAVGWVYWFRNVNTARCVAEYMRKTGTGIRQGEMENHTLFRLGAYHMVKENLLTRASARVSDDALRQCVASGSVEMIAEETPVFKQLKAILAVTGISVEHSEKGLHFGFRPPEDTLTLAMGVPHPWIMDREVTEVGRLPDSELFSKIEETNHRLSRMIQLKAPQKLMQKDFELLGALVCQYFNELLTPASLIPGGEVHFSTRAVAAPGKDLTFDQIGIPEDMAWSLFGPLVMHELKDQIAVDDRTEKAGKVLDRVMAEHRLLVNRAPTLTSTALTSFHSVRHHENVIRFHPLVCPLLNLDFDGDQVAVMLPLTNTAQKEADTKLSVCAHLERKPELLKNLLPPDAMWGVIHASRSQQGEAELANLAGFQFERINGHVTRENVFGALERYREKKGMKKTIQLIDKLAAFGFSTIAASGASISPFPDSFYPVPDKIESPGDTGEKRRQYRAQVLEHLLSLKDFENNPLGPQLIFLHAQPGDAEDILDLVLDSDPGIWARPAKPSCSEGLADDQLYNGALDAQAKIMRHQIEINQLAKDIVHRNKPEGSTVLARAFRSEYPGIVFARAAADGEVDPLTERMTQLLVGV